VKKSLDSDSEDKMKVDKNSDCRNFCNETIWSICSIVLIFLTERYSSGDKIHLRATYNPNLLPNHWGPYFQHPNAKLIQLDSHNVNENLITPWDTYNKL
jgi:hypothetical protein